MRSGEQEWRGPGMILLKRKLNHGRIFIPLQDKNENKRPVGHWGLDWQGDIHPRSEKRRGAR